MNPDIFRNKNILVTGGTGSIGREIVKQLLEADVNRIIVMSRDEIKHFVMRKELLDERLEFVVGDVRDFQSASNVFKLYDVDIVFHAAAMKHVVISEEFPFEAVKTNIIGTQNLVDLALHYGVEKFVTISTDKAANPTTVMGATKFIAERITLNASRLASGSNAFMVVRFGNVANSRGSVIPIFVTTLLKKRTLFVSDPEVTRFIMRISDAVKLVFRATELGMGGELFILKMPAFRLGDLVDVMVEDIAPLLGINPKDVKVKLIGLSPGEKLHEHLINEVESYHVEDLGEMYRIFLEEDKVLSKPDYLEYTSKDAPRLSKEELRDIVTEYLKARVGLYNTF
ncbi:SDR family NAD(P)-dependent oxidoreductase [Thermococcus sp. M36]|nr:SDR family NAD(P)-dependent oxidoreductase [Thermococcus sp. M36]